MSSHTCDEFAVVGAAIVVVVISSFPPVDRSTRITISDLLPVDLGLGNDTNKMASIG